MKDSACFLEKTKQTGYSSKGDVQKEKEKNTCGPFVSKNSHQNY